MERGGRLSRLDSWTSRFRSQNGISLSTGSVQHQQEEERVPLPPVESESTSVGDDRLSASVPPSEADYEDEDVVEATEWSQVVAAARGLTDSRARQLIASSPTPLRRMRSLQPGYRSSEFYAASPVHDHHRYHTSLPVGGFKGLGGVDDNTVVGGMQLDELDLDVNLHLVTSGGRGGTDGFRFDYEPVGATSLHGTVVTDGTTKEALQERIQELEWNRDGDIAAAATERNEELENHNACLSERLRALEDELEFSKKASDDEVAALNRRIRELRKSHSDNMAAAAEEFVSLNERLQAKDGELRAKEAETAQLQQVVTIQQRQETTERGTTLDQLPSSASPQTTSSSTMTSSSSPEMKSSSTMTSFPPPHLTSTSTMTSFSSSKKASTSTMTSFPSPQKTSSSTMTSLPAPKMTSTSTMTSPSTARSPPLTTASVSSAKPIVSSTPLMRKSSLLFFRSRAMSTSGVPPSRALSLPMPNSEGDMATKLKLEAERDFDASHGQASLRSSILGGVAENPIGSFFFDGSSIHEGIEEDGEGLTQEAPKKERRSRFGRVAREYFRISRNGGSWRDKRFSRLRPVNRSPPRSMKADSKDGKDVPSSPVLAVAASTHSDAPTTALSTSSSISASSPASENSPNGSESSSCVTNVTPDGATSSAMAQRAPAASTDEATSRSVPEGTENNDENDAAATTRAVEEAERGAAERERMAGLALKAAADAESEARARSWELLSLLEAAQAKIAEAEAKAEDALKRAAEAESVANKRESAARVAETVASVAEHKAHAQGTRAVGLLASAQAKAARAETKLAEFHAANAEASKLSSMANHQTTRFLPPPSPVVKPFACPLPVKGSHAVTVRGTIPGTVPNVPKGLVSERATAYMALATASAMATAATARMRTKVMEQRNA